MKTDSGLDIEILEEGDGPKPVAGQTVHVHYTGTLEDGTQFDSSHNRGQPLAFPLGQGNVIQGWDEGIGQCANELWSHHCGVRHMSNSSIVKQ